MSEALPEDYPGKTAVFPAPIERLVYALLGVQAHRPGAGALSLAALAKLLTASDGPARVERLREVAAEGAESEVLLACWSDPARHARWRAAHFDPWWRALPLDGPVGVWFEIIEAHKDYYQYGAGVPEAGGISALGKLVPCDKFGYWGGYRDRVPASTHDDFAPALDAMPARVTQHTLGRRVSVTAPDNLCFIREGQGWEHAGEDERRVWKDKMDRVARRWVDELREHPAETGCFSLRHCREADVTSGAPLARQSQLAFLLSLAHIERAARANHAHLEVKQRFTEMYTEPRFTPRMHIWVEMFIVKQGGLANGYANCRGDTGLLPYFPAADC